MLNLVFIKIFQEQIKRTFFECINYILPHWVTLFFFLWVYHFSLISAYFCNPYYSYSDVVCLMSISEFFEDRLQANWSLLQKKKTKMKVIQGKSIKREVDLVVQRLHKNSIRKIGSFYLVSLVLVTERNMFSKS